MQSLRIQATAHKRAHTDFIHWRITMKTILALIMTLGFSAYSFAQQIAAPAISGYDPVAYFETNKAERGSGMFTSEYKGKTYLFATEDRKEKFDKTPEKFLPQYGGWCAFGAALGKKFHSDPTVFAVVDGKLYLNLNSDIQGKWNKDKKANIKKADSNWKKISNKKAADL